MPKYFLKSSIILLLLLNWFPMQAQRIAKEQAIADIDEFEAILIERSSYIHLSDFGWKYALQQMRNIFSKQDSVETQHLLYMLKDVLSRIGDRHARINGADRVSPEKTHYLPFALAPFEGKAIAVKKNRRAPFTILHPGSPFLKAINSQPIESFVEPFNVRGRSAPPAARLLRSVEELRYLGRMLEFLQVGDPSTANFTFTNGTKDTTVMMPLSDRRGSWGGIGDMRDRYK